MVGDLGVKRQEALHAWMRARGYRPAAMMRVIGIGKVALNRALKRGELAQCPHILTVPVGQCPPMSRPLDLPEPRRVYWNAQPHVQALMLWALGTGARPQAILELHSRQIEFEFGLIHLNPPDREQVPKKYRPAVRLPDALWREFEGWAVAWNGEPVKNIKNALWRACDRGGVERCAPYSFRHTAARWMRAAGFRPGRLRRSSVIV